jgi:peroxiredoxin
LTEISKKQVEEAEFPFKVCSDLDDTVMKAYKLCFSLDPELAEVYKKFNFQVESDNGGNGRLSLPVPGTFVIDQSSTIRAMQADTEYTNRMKPAEISEGLIEIKGIDDKMCLGCIVS